MHPSIASVGILVSLKGSVVVEEDKAYSEPLIIPLLI